VRFERRARLTCACSRSSGSAGRAREAHQPQRPRAALQASTRAAPMPESTRTASQAPWGPLGGRQERASVAERVLGVKVRQTAFRARWSRKKKRPKMVNKLPTRLLEARAAASGAALVLGIDDCGRGAIAGPIFAAAALLPTLWSCPAEFGDAKVLSAGQRSRALRALDDAGALWATAAVSAAAVDAVGHRAATEAAMALAARRLLRRLGRAGVHRIDAPCHCLVDGDSVPAGPWLGDAVPQGDASECCISAASIAARVR